MDRRSFLSAASAAAAAAGIKGTVEAVEPTDRTIIFLQPNHPVSPAVIEHLREQWDALYKGPRALPRMVVLPAGWKMTVLTDKATGVESGP